MKWSKEKLLSKKGLWLGATLILAFFLMLEYIINLFPESSLPNRWNNTLATIGGVALAYWWHDGYHRYIYYKNKDKNR